MRAQGPGIALASCLLAVSLTVEAADAVLSFSSGRQQVSVLELYTSEGCSSCPPADAWLRRWRNHPDLWQRIIPLAFHVDYWDSLGWTDAYARSEYSARQRHYAQAAKISSVYTPGFVRNGREWRGWFHGDDPLDLTATAAAALTVRLENGRWHAVYAGAAPQATLWVANLAFDQQSAVARGENAGRVLRHDFVVTTLTRYPGQKLGNQWTWRLDYAAAEDGGPRRAIAFWVTGADDTVPLQATGGWLP